MTDLVKLWSRHGDRLRKWLPETFKADCDPVWPFYLEHGRDTYTLTEAEVSIFLEHAARRAVEKEWHRLGYRGSNHNHTGWVIEDFVDNLDTLFPEEKPNV